MITLIVVLPHNIVSDILIAFIYLLIIILIFNRYPRLVGSKYLEEGYDKLRMFESKIISKFQ